MVAANSTEEGNGGNQEQSRGLGMMVQGTPGAAAPVMTGNAGLSSDDPTKKIRKPYTITKSRESWTEQEHDKFLEALQLFDRDWKKIEAFVGSKTVIQIRSHAQKYFLKVQKNGLCEHVPPPRPKRKAAHPYPQKASKNVTLPSQTTVPYQAPPYLAESGYPIRTESSAVHRNCTAGTTEASWNQNSTQPNTSHAAKDDTALAGTTAVNNCCSSSESPLRKWPASETTDPANHVRKHHVTPDFARVYSFIGSVFDPNASDHLQKLKKMDPIDVETVLLLMRNLSINLMSPDFEDHRRLFSSYDVGSEETKSVSAKDSFHSNKAIST